MPDGHRIALTLAGGVSLGAYQAGVVYELLRALGQQTEDPHRLGRISGGRLRTLPSLPGPSPSTQKSPSATAASWGG